MRLSRSRLRSAFQFSHIEHLEQRTVFSAGQLDLTFGTAGSVRTEFDTSTSYGDTALATVVDDLTRIVAAGEGGMARILNTGALDLSFGQSGRVPLPFYARALALQGDGKLVVAGGTAEFNSTDLMIARYTSTGELDGSFAGDGVAQIDLGGINEWATSLLVEPNGKIVVAGGAGNAIAMARLLTNGELDSNFSGDGWFTRQVNHSDTANGLARQANGQLLVVGTSLVQQSYPTTNFDMLVMRVNTNGTVDGNFGISGMAYANFTSNYYSRDQGTAIAVQADGKIVISGSVYGSFYSYTGIARLLSDGQYDMDYGNEGRTRIQASSDFASSQISTMGDGRVLVTNLQGIMMLDDQGLLDSSFNQNGYVSAGGLVRGLARQSDGRIILAGTFFNGFGVKRLMSDGSSDLSFSLDAVAIAYMGPSSDTATHSVAQPDGKVIVVGGSRRGFEVARYDENGQLDSNFSNDGLLIIEFGEQYYDALATAVIVQTDGRIVVSGWLHESGNATTISRMGIVRLNVDGSLDLTFSGDGLQVSDLGGYAEANALALGSDGKLVVAGSWNDRATVWRLNTDGSYDTRFSGDGVVSMATEASVISSIVLQPDGRILAAGNVRPSSFITTSYASVLMVARFNVNGSLDTSFGINGKMVDPGNRLRTADDIALLPDGRFVVVGDTTIYSQGSEWSQLAVARYLTDGSRDGVFGTQIIDQQEFYSYSDFESGTARSWGTSIARQSDGKLVVAGYTDQRMLVARLNEDGSFDSSFAGDGKMDVSLTGESIRASNVLLLPNNRLIVSGTVRGATSGVLENDFYVVRLTNDPVPVYSTSIRLNAQGYIEILDVWGRDDYLQFYQSSDDAIVISDASEDTRSRFRVINLPGVAGDGTRELTIPLTLLQLTAKPLLINSMEGNDSLLISSTFNAPPTGMMFKAGDGNDGVLYPQSQVPVAWVLSTSNSGSARPQGKVPINFTGVESLVGGTQYDSFRLAHTPTSTLLRIDGSGAGLDSIELRADANMSFTRQPISHWGQRLNVESSTGTQQIAMRFISSARLIGGVSDNVIDASEFRGPVSLYGAGGNDVLFASTNSSALYGDDGNDRLYGSVANDVLRGGRGDDLLVGNYGSDDLYGDDGWDILSGDNGIDRLWGGNEDDLLIGGLALVFAYNADPIARDAVLATWRSADSYATKIQKLTVDGVGADNSVKLQYGSTLFYDYDVDTYFGNSGIDWFIANQVTETGLPTTGIRDRNGEEQIYS